jgi:predicted nucleic acid-binding protein
MQVVIADAGPIIALSRMGRLGLLAQLFKTVWITQVVLNELQAQPITAFAGQTDIQSALAQWLQVQSDLGAEYEPISATLDAGELSSIRLCLKHPGSLLVVDDQAGRLEAAAQKLNFTGLVGLLLRAHERGFITDLHAVLLELRAQNYFLSDTLIAQVLALARQEPV